MNATMLGLRYGLFALAATAVNLATQHACLRLMDALAPAMVGGTMTGLLTKYMLDKRWIFADPSSGLAAHTRKLGLYSLMGVLTTGIFWGTELAFDTLFQSAVMRDLGAILGLAVGYVAKYRLDRRFVFAEAPR